MKFDRQLRRTVSGLLAAGLIGASTLLAPATATATTTSRAAQTAGLSDFDKKYLVDGMYAMYFETEFGQMARTKATHPKVRAYGEQFLHDHGSFRDELVALAEEYRVELPTELHAEGKQLVASVKAQSGADFDRAWAEASAMGHQIAVMEGRVATKQADNPRVKALAVRDLTDLERHYSSALALARQLGTKNPELINAGEGPTPVGGPAPIALGALLLLGVSAFARRSLVAPRRSS